MNTFPPLKRHYYNIHSHLEIFSATFSEYLERISDFVCSKSLFSVFLKHLP